MARTRSASRPRSSTGTMEAEELLAPPAVGSPASRCPVARAFLAGEPGSEVSRRGSAALRVLGDAGRALRIGAPAAAAAAAASQSGSGERPEDDEEEGDWLVAASVGASASGDGPSG
eukprot:1880688-Alexandrium_andersonii.AAC.1